MTNEKQITLLLSEVAATVEDGPTAQEEQRQADFVAQLVPQRRSVRWFAVVAATTIAAATVLVGAGWASLNRAHHERQRVARPDLHQGMDLVAEESDLVLEVDRQNRVTLVAGGRMRVKERSNSELDIELAEGGMTVDKQSSSIATWSVRAASTTLRVDSAVVHVKYTSETSRRLHVAVQEGTVRVERDGHPSLVLRAGQRLTHPRVFRSPPPPADSSPLTPTAVEKIPEPRQAMRKRTRPSAAREHLWVELAERREFKAAIREVKRVGLSQVMNDATADHLRALADAARYTGETDVAAQALVRLREVYPRHRRSRNAAFLLGRLELEQRNRPGDAAKWFETYAHESPKAPLASNARGRAFQSYKRAGDRVAARRVAKEILELDPAGPYSAVARSMLESP